MPLPQNINNQFKYLQWGTGKVRRNQYVGGVIDQWYTLPTDDYLEGNENYNALYGIGYPFTDENYISPNGGTGIFYVCTNFSIELRTPTSNQLFQSRIILSEDNGATITSGGEITQALMQHDNDAARFPVTISAIFRITDAFYGGYPPIFSPQYRNISSNDQASLWDLSLTVIRLS